MVGRLSHALILLDGVMHLHPPMTWHGRAMGITSAEHGACLARAQGVNISFFNTPCPLARIVVGSAPAMVLQHVPRAGTTVVLTSAPQCSACACKPQKHYAYVCLI